MILDLKTNMLIKTVNLIKEYSFILGNIMRESCRTHLRGSMLFGPLRYISLRFRERQTFGNKSTLFFKSNSSSFQYYNIEVAEKLGFITFLSGIALSDRNDQGYRTLYIQPTNMSYVFSTSTKTLLNPNTEEASNDICI